MSGKYALIIASYEYDSPKLRRLDAPAQDAETLAGVLQNPEIGDFDVETLLNVPSYEANRAIESFFAKRKRDDLALLYFSGHGIKDDDGLLYFATPDTSYETPRSTAIQARFVNEVMANSRSRRKVLLLDSCYSGAFGRTKGGESVGIAEQIGGQGRVVLTSSDALQYSFEGDDIKGEKVRSVFTHALVRGLESGEADLRDDGQISLDELYDYVYDVVTAEKGAKQEPLKFADVKGEPILIARNQHWVIKPTPLPDDLRALIESRYAGARAGAVIELEQLIHGSDQGLVLAAYQALVHLQDDDSRRVSTVAADVLHAINRSLADKLSLTRAGSIAEESPPVGVSQTENVNSAKKLIPTRSPSVTEVTDDLPTGLKDTANRSPKISLRYLLSLLPTWAMAGSGVVVVALLITWSISSGLWSSKPTSLLTSTPTPTLTLIPPTLTSSPTPISTVVPTFTPTPTQTAIPTLTYTPTPAHSAGEARYNSTDGMVMVYVPGGTFLMGSDESDVNAETDEFPQHLVILDGFWIYKTEVPNDKYALCVEDQVCEKPRFADDPYRNVDDYPVVGISAYDAEDYCLWAGGRLPTEAEWEYAARGEEGPLYPWGDQFDCSRGNFGGEEACDEYEGYAPVGSFPTGASWCGALDMSGNVSEWVDDWYDEFYYTRVESPVRNPLGPAGWEPMSKVVRGGSFSPNVMYVRTTSRSQQAVGGNNAYLGFRCVDESP